MQQEGTKVRGIYSDAGKLSCSGILPANNEFLLQVKADENSLERSYEYSSCLGCGDVCFGV